MGTDSFDERDEKKFEDMTKRPVDLYLLSCEKDSTVQISDTHFVYSVGGVEITLEAKGHDNIAAWVLSRMREEITATRALRQICSDRADEILELKSKISDLEDEICRSRERD